ncbi:parallel beta-helix domain-containing protein [Phenylobacterium parvum]|uniref:parallel beta-helix domain-containing protein n=1 Tax=Phenylobacterium parvum TaxID=2201350 RepID=UPI0018EFC7F7|nr:parallel beta-helix domain-containing protein [Phenylobacterium parvum]
MSRTTFALAVVLLAAPALAHAATLAVAPGPDAQERLQTALLDAKPGDTVRIAAGRYDLTDGLSLDVDGVTVAGAGPGATILSFKGQKGSGEGLLITSDRVTVKDLAVEDTRGDGIKSKGADDIRYLNLRVEWTGGPKETNGAYGVYPVSSQRVLIDGVTVRGASDAGIYVGQSRHIVVRNSRAEFNVAGIEIENSMFADVHDNVATRNAGGILVFDLPNLPQMGGHSTRVFNNRVVDNDTPNFAPKGNIVASVPTGTGVMVMANRNIHVFGNEVSGNQSAGVLLVSYTQAFNDPAYNPCRETSSSATTGLAVTAGTPGSPAARRSPRPWAGPCRPSSGTGYAPPPASPPRSRCAWPTARSSTSTFRGRAGSTPPPRPSAPRWSTPPSPSPLR